MTGEQDGQRRRRAVQADGRASARRWLSIGLRTGHLVGVAGVGGAFLLAAPEPAGRPYLWLLLLTGVALAAVQIGHRPVRLLEVRGQALVAKVLLLLLIPVWESAAAPLFIAVIVIAGVISHAPGSVRYHSVWHGRRLE